MSDRKNEPLRVDPLAAIPSLLWGMEGCARALGISRSTLERERSAGRFPPPDRQIGRRPLWTPETVRRWIGMTAAPAAGVTS